MDHRIRDSPVPPRPVFFITGGQGEGKTTLLLNIVAELRRRGLNVRGFAAPGTFSDGLRAGFSLLDLATGRSEEFCSRTRVPENIQHGPYYFRPDVLYRGYRILAEARDPAETDLLVIDEVGRFELMGAIWSEGIDRLLTLPTPPMIWTVRRCFLSEVMRRWGLWPSLIIEAGSDEEEAAEGILREILRNHSDNSEACPCRDDCLIAGKEISGPPVGHDERESGS